MLGGLVECRPPFGALVCRHESHSAPIHDQSTSHQPKSAPLKERCIAVSDAAVTLGAAVLVVQRGARVSKVVRESARWRGSEVSMPYWFAGVSAAATKRAVMLFTSRRSTVTRTQAAASQAFVRSVLHQRTSLLWKPCGFRMSPKRAVHRRNLASRRPLWSGAAPASSALLDEQRCRVRAQQGVARLQPLPLRLFLLRSR